MSPLPTITLTQLSEGIESTSTDPNVKKVLEGLLNDFMDLQHGRTTPYTTGKQILPSETTIDNVVEGIKDKKAPVFVRDALQKIEEAYRKGDLTPQPNDGSWDAKFTPVLQLVKGDN